MTCMTSSQAMQKTEIRNSGFWSSVTPMTTMIFGINTRIPLMFPYIKERVKQKLKKLVKTERAKIKVENTRQNRTCKNKS